MQPPKYDHYPYELLTSKQIADITRQQDRHITDLRHENQMLKEELYQLQKWRDKIIPILIANEINVEEATDVMAATEKAFKE